MSKIQVNEIVNHFDNGAPDCPRGLTVTGVSTFSGNVSVGGTLSYEDVTNIDSVGIITARDGLDTPINLVLRTLGTERLRIDENGYVGIGTDGPSELLHVFSNSTAEIKLHTSGVSSPALLELKSPSNGKVDFTPDTSNNASGRILYSHADDSMSFSTKESGGNITERLRIDSAGLVGIGTVVPLAKLHVSGSAWDNATGGDVIISNSSTIGSSLNLRPTNSGSHSAGWSLYAGASGSAIGDGNIGFWNHTDSTAPFKITQSGDASITDGNLVVASGHGIDFSATGDASGMTSELLDDYEEGTWTPAINAGSVSTYNWATGRYTKIGNVVTIWFDIKWTSASSIPSQGQITGLPITAIANNLKGGYGAPVFRDASGVHSDIRIYGNSSYISAPTSIIVQGYNSSGSAGGYTFNSDGRVTGWAQYFTNEP